MYKPRDKNVHKSEALRTAIGNLFEIVSVIDTTCLTAGNMLSIINSKTTLNTSYFVLANVLKEYPGCIKKELRASPNTTPRVYYNFKLLK